MPRLITFFNRQIDVPQWEFCNVQEDKDTRRDSQLCRFAIGTTNQKGCSLFNVGLYSYREWVKKCDECLRACEEDGHGGE
jgi:hypothetical protein